MTITVDDYALLIAAPMLQDYLVDKDTGTPLAGGIVTFYRDDARTVLKNVYYQTGSPGAYTYIPLPNPNTLTSVGTIADDGGNDTIPFFFPYDEDDPDIIQKYYVTIYSADSNGNPAILQFTRENFPFLVDQGDDGGSDQDLLNLIPNGQFPSHNNLPNNGVFPNGDSSFTVAQGGSAGWYYTKNDTSTDTDVILFDQILQEPSNLLGNPRYAINVACTSTAGDDTFKELRVRFNNVNRFASDTQNYTFSFAGQNKNAGTVNVAFKIIKYFGVGGSSTQEIEIEQFTLESNQYNQFSTSFIFGTNSEDTIGTGNDDYIELVIAFPATSVFSVDLTNFILTPGIIVFNDYPERPDNMVFANAISGSLPTPNPDGSDLYLPMVLTRAGATFDGSSIGEIVGNVTSTVTGNLLPCDGSSFLTSAYSSLGIPYSRLQAVLMAATATNIPLYGTGATFATANIQNSSSNTIRLSTNQGGAQTGAAEGSIATGFAFSNIHTGQTVNVKGYSLSATSIIGIGNTAIGTSNAAAHTSGFTVSQVVNTLTNTYPIFQVTTISAGAMAGGTYFTFSNSATNYYCWFKIDGVGADPAPGGTGIEVDLLSTFTATDVASCVREAISGYQISAIVCTSAATIPAGSFWTFNANGTAYSVWYQVAGSGTAPNTGTPIKVTLDGTETSAQVATKTQLAINNVYFAVPDLRGCFLLGNRGTGQFETSASTRFSSISDYFGNNVGTFEQMQLTNETAALASPLSQLLNSYINWFIRY